MQGTEEGWLRQRVGKNSTTVKEFGTIKLELA